MIINNVIDECARFQVNKLLMPIGGCSYPDTDENNEGFYKEIDLFNGMANRNSFGYSMAKRNSVVAAMAYKQQFNLDTTIVIPTNPIGPFDNTDEQNSHVVMALIGKFLDAIEEGYTNVIVAGSGKPERDFLYIEDIVKVFPVLIDKYDEVGPINISSGKGTTIAELAEAIAKITGFSGNIHYDRSRPDGQARKILDNSLLLDILKENNIEWNPMSLEDALSITIEWYKKRVLGK